MNRDDIIRMAREVSLPPCLSTHPKALARFAALVAAQKHEESIGDVYAHRLAIMLECALLDPAGTWNDAHALLDDYRKAVQAEHEAAGETYASAFGRN